MPFDLPPKARSPCLASSWQKALNYRDFQDKLLRVIQYSSRGVAFYLLRADPSHVLGTKLFNLYKGLSLSRKAFRCLRSLADIVTAAGKAATIGAKPVPGILGTVQWLLMSAHIFWDNMFFCTHPIVALIDRPESKWFNNDATNQHQKNWRAMSDVTGLVAALLAWRKSQQAVADAVNHATQDSAGNNSIETAKAKRKESFYSMLKLIADVATYFPQCAWMTWTRWSNKHGWHDGYIGVMGVIAALCSCRSEWIKMG